METQEPSTPTQVSDEELKQIFRDILKGPTERRAAFDRLQKMEAESGVERLPGSLHIKEPKKNKKKGKKDKAGMLSADNLKRLFELYKDNKEVIEEIVKMGGSFASAIVGFLLARKGAAPSAE